MAVAATRHTFTTATSQTISYLEAGPTSGPLLIFVHGWPGIAETWKYQIENFALLGFHVVAPDTRGYGQSTANKDSNDYRLELLVGDCLALLNHLERPQAVWIGHDWGSAIVWALAAHHPEICKAVVNLAVPYQTLELGLERLLTLINRDIYPVDEYPNGPWDYQVFYEKNSARATQLFDANVPNAVKIIYAKAIPALFGKPAGTSGITKAGGWFGGAETCKDIPLSMTVFDKDPALYQATSDALSKTGFHGATSYYLNHAANIAYARSQVGSGVLEMPCLFLEARHDAVCATNLSRMSEPMRQHCRNLTEASIDAAHWLQLEKPTDVNAVLARWLATNVQDWWPGFWSTPLVQRPVYRV